MKLKLINGLFYLEHKLKLDNKRFIDEITSTRNNPTGDLNDSRPSHKDVDMKHTFYEDVPLTNETYDIIGREVTKTTDKMFGIKNALELTEIWGHFTAPGDQTMIHNHNAKGSRGLSFVYYPHMPKKAGNLTFCCQVDQNRVMLEVASQKGHIYFFSRDILHFVTRNASKENRISVSGNLVIGAELNTILNNDKQFENYYWFFAGRDGDNEC